MIKQPKAKLPIINKYILSLTLILISACASFNKGEIKRPTYEEWLASCKDYKDVAKWQEKYLIYDKERLQESLSRSKANLPRLRAQSPEDTFRIKRGICMDAAVFTKVSLNRINPEYKAEIVHLFPGPLPLIDHYVCAFYVNGKLFIMDYGTTYRQTEGTHGPFKDLDDYVHSFYLKYHPKHKSFKWYKFGWPPWRSFEPW